MTEKGSKQELLKHFMELFPVEGHVEGAQELKMKIVMKYGDQSKEVVERALENMNELIEELKERGVLNEFEFNGTVNYKAKKDIPVSLGGATGTAPSPSSGKLDALSKLVVALAEASDDANVQALLTSYKEKYT